MKQTCALLLVILLLAAVINVYGQEDSQQENTVLKLDRVYYDDENCLYITSDRQMLRLNKDFTGSFDVLSADEQIDISKEQIAYEESYTINYIEIEEKDVAIQDGLLYYNGLKLLNVQKYIDTDNTFYEQNANAERMPMYYRLYRYEIDKEKNLYFIQTYTCTGVPAPYTPVYYDYVLIDGEDVKKIELDYEYFGLYAVYKNDDKLWLEGVNRSNWIDEYKMLYCIDKNAKAVSVNDIMSSKYNKNYKDTSFDVKIIGKNGSNLILREMKNAAGSWQLSGFYEIDNSLDIKIRSEDINIANEKYVNHGDFYYLSRDNELYYICQEANAVVNLTKEKLKKLEYNEDTDKITVIAAPTTAKVLINGKETAFQAFNINGNNFFKLRDIAMALNGTEKQFEVAWDGASKEISLTTGIAYTSVGGELFVPDNTAARIALPSTAKVKLDGQEVMLTAYNIDGNNYFKLRDLGKAIDFGVLWNGETKTITIDTSAAYSE